MAKLLFLTLFFFVAIGYTMPSAVVILRHAEEPENGPEGRELSAKGWKRAEGLPLLFKSNNELLNLGPISHLIAAKPHKKMGSIRPIQTVQPLSKALNIKIQSEHSKEQIEELIQALAHSSAYTNKVVVIAWQHDTISELAHRLGATNAPKQWGGKTFDRFWIIDFKNGQAINFRDRSQKIFKSDSKN